MMKKKSENRERWRIPRTMKGACQESVNQGIRIHMVRDPEKEIIIVMEGITWKLCYACLLKQGKCHDYLVYGMISTIRVLNPKSLV